MRYLITGSTGFIGPHLIRKLVALGHSCRCLVRANSDTKKLENLDIEFVRGDITDAKTLAGIADGVDCVLHMATLGHMSNFSVEESMFEEVNVQGTVNIMEEALNAGVKKIVHCSTVAAMGICRDVPATEESECNPHHAYGRSKLKAEKEVLRMVSEYDLPAVLIRFSMVYGPGDWRDMLKLARMAKKNLFPRVGNRPKLTPLIHVRDAVEGLLLAAQKGRNGEVYLITNQRSEPFDKLIKILQESLGVHSISLYVPEWVALTAASIIEKTFVLLGKTPPVARKNIESTLADRVFSIEKARKELEFNPKIDPVTGIKETVNWYKKMGWV